MREEDDIPPRYPWDSETPTDTHYIEHERDDGSSVRASAIAGIPFASPSRDPKASHEVCIGTSEGELLVPTAATVESGKKDVGVQMLSARLQRAARQFVEEEEEWMGFIEKSERR